MRIVSWNVENLAPWLTQAPGSRGREGLGVVLARFGQPDLLCLQEVRVRPADGDLVRAMNSALPGYVCHASLCNDPQNVTFRGGRMYGVATYVKKALRSRLLERFSWEREGRVVVTVLPSRKLAVINVYAVNGTDKPFFDHELGRISGDRHQWKRRFIARLGDECQALIERDLELVVIGDFNVSRSKLDTYPRLRTEEPHALARKAFNEVFMPEQDLVDAFRELHPDARKYTWRNRRARAGTLDAARVDFALVSRSLLPRIRVADIDEAPSASFGSDHAPLFVEIEEPSTS